MRRITRLLSGPPSPGGWGALVALGVLAVSSVLLATQFGLAGGRLPELNVQSSTAGELGPGDYREITANGLNHQRVYRVSLDAQRQLSEVYREDGQVRPIDAATRRWIAAVSRMGPPPTPPVPPLSFDATAECKALVQLLAAHRDVIARLGTPVVATSKPVDGHIHFVDADGQVDVPIELRGPRGQATVRVEAEFRAGIWTVRSLHVQ